MKTFIRLTMLCVLALVLLCIPAAAETVIGEWTVEEVFHAALQSVQVLSSPAPVILGGESAVPVHSEAPEFNALYLVEYAGSAERLEIPAELTMPDGRILPVIGLGENLFSRNDRLSEIIVPDSVTYVGAGAFCRCSGLRRVKLPSSLEELPGDLFFGCTRLEEIELPGGLRRIGAGCFEECVQLAQMKLPETVEEIGERAFMNCAALEKVSLPRRVRRVGGRAFAHTPWLAAQDDAFFIAGDGVLLACRAAGERIELPRGVRMISSAFEGRSDIRRIVLPEGLEEIGEYAFEGCEGLEIVDLPQSLRRIGHDAFAGCAALQSVYTGTRLKEIGARAFMDCRSLRTVSLAEGLTVLGEEAFRGCTALREIALPEGVRALERGVLADCTALERVRVPLSVQTVADDALTHTQGVWMSAVYGSAGERFARSKGMSCAFLQQNDGEYVYMRTEQGICILRYTGQAAVLEMPDRLDGVEITSISAGAFQQAESLRSIRISAGVRHLDDWVFSGLEKLEQVMLPSGLTHLGANVFSGCPALREIYLPEGLSTLEEGVFDGCTRLTVLADADSEIFALAQAAGLRTVDILTGYDVFRYKKRDGELALCGCDAEERTLSLPAFYAGRAVTAVGAGSFAGGSWTVTVPEGYTTLEEGAFINCTGLDITLPAGLVYIEEDALYGCSDVTIRGYVGSAAEEYARAMGYRFIVRHDW